MNGMSVEVRLLGGRASHDVFILANAQAAARRGEAHPLELEGAGSLRTDPGAALAAGDSGVGHAGRQARVRVVEGHQGILQHQALHQAREGQEGDGVQERAQQGAGLRAQGALLVPLRPSHGGQGDPLQDAADPELLRGCPRASPGRGEQGGDRELRRGEEGPDQARLGRGGDLRLPAERDVARGAPPAARR